MSTCRSCSAEIVWAVTPKGKRIPVDPEPSITGNLLLSLDTPPVAEVIGPDDLLFDDGKRFVTHFVTCPNAGIHRRPR